MNMQCVAVVHTYFELVVAAQEVARRRVIERAKFLRCLGEMFAQDSRMAFSSMVMKLTSFLCRSILTMID